VEVKLMQRDEVIRILAGHRMQIRALGVKSLALFGSVARGDDRPDSDIDVLVEFHGAATFDQYMDLKFLLEELLGRRVDLVSTRGLRPQLRSYVERDVLYVA
jgi:predicted nucleotidyltransferase